MLAESVSASSELNQGGVRAVVHRCAERVRPGAALLLRVVERLSRQHPLSLLDATQLSASSAPADAVVAWQDARRGSTFCAWGISAQISTTGPSRMRRAALEAAALAERTTTVDTRGRPAVDDELPLFCGGFSFAARVGARGPWRDWPAGWLFVPRFLVHRSGNGTTTLVISESITHDTHPELVMQRLCSALRFRPTPRPARQPQPVAATRLSEEAGALQSWISAVSRAHANIRAGSLQKVVLARSVALQRPDAPFDLLASLERLRQQHGDPSDGCTLYALRHPSGRTFLGASPETLADLDGLTLRTSALAGTAARDLDPARDAAAADALVHCAKEQREHEFVVKAIVEAIRPRCARLEVDDRPRVRRLRAVQHLETVVTAQLKGPTHLLQLVDALHPTPAVGGWPTRAALEWIAANEQLERGWYAGPIGWLTRRGDGHFVVALRCALVGAHTAWAFAGAGLTESSKPAREWTETVLKLQTIADALAGQRAQNAAQ